MVWLEFQWYCSAVLFRLPLYNVLALISHSFPYGYGGLPATAGQHASLFPSVELEKKHLLQPLACKFFLSVCLGHCQLCAQFLGQLQSPGECYAQTGLKLKLPGSIIGKGGWDSCDGLRVIESDPGDVRKSISPGHIVWMGKGWLPEQIGIFLEEEGEQMLERKKKSFWVISGGFWSLVKESFGQSASWSVAKCLCLDPLQPDYNFLLHSVDAASANTSHHWLIILASWHLTLLQAPLMELKIPLAGWFWHVLI